MDGSICVVLLLVLDIIYDRLPLTRGHAEDAVSFLPEQSFRLWKFIVQKAGRERLNLFDDMGRGEFGRNLEQQMDMVLDTTQGTKHTFQSFRLLNYAPMDGALPFH